MITANLATYPPRRETLIAVKPETGYERWRKLYIAPDKGIVVLSDDA